MVILKIIWLTSLPMISTSLDIRKVIVGSNFVQIVFYVLYNARCSIFNQVVHSVECFEDSSPVFRFWLDFWPEMFHDNIVVFPVVGVVGKNLKFWIWNVPVLIRGTLFEDCLVFLCLEYTFFLTKSYWKAKNLTDCLLRCRGSLSLWEN